ncbi:Protein transport protein sec72 [Choanephora cucurbitarum]|uniref:Protein transport protein sec72 n=1 Tax=Choanephora cucurbitarum TaxID=101091 RepID=A0A1C7NLV8_9FUNG|nr:Protein transport protein sec72 [Choanephora cucurbitarum]
MVSPTPSSPRLPQQSSITSSNVFIINALEKIASAKEAKRNKDLKDAVEVALNLLKNKEAAPEGQTRSTAILAALQQAIDTRSANLMTIALDCLGKFITYNYVADMEDEVAQSQAMERVVNGICDCFIGEETDKKVQLQIIKALLDAVYSTSNPLHLTTLLKAVRTTYNIFLLSRNNDNQNVAQITMTQMVDHIFRRVKSNPNVIPEKVETEQADAEPQEYSESKEQKSREDNEQEQGEQSEQGSINEEEQNVNTEETQQTEAENEVVSSTNNASEETEGETTTYQQQIIAEANMAQTEMNHKLPSGRNKDNYQDFLNDTANVFQENQENNGTIASHGDTQPQSASDDRGSFEDERIQNGSGFETEADLYIKDAILVFRALCKLSKKSIQSEWGNDMRSYSMRSKLLSLHLILTIMMSHMDVFTSEDIFFSSDIASGHRVNPFILEVKQYLCPSIGRNAFSVVPQVFDITHEILWRIVQGLRVYLKNEIEIFLKEIVLRILEMRTASNQQKFSLLKGVLRICEDPQTLVDIYLNYDCDRAALDNIYERLVNVLSKITTSHHQSTNGKDFDSHPDPFSSAHGSHVHSSAAIPPPLTTATILHTDKQNAQAALPESAIRFKSLECLVGVLRSLVGWYENNSVSITASGMGTNSRREEDTPRASEDQASSSLTTYSNASSSRLGINNGSAVSTPPTIGSSTRLDDPEAFENLKHRKQLLQEGIRQFNWKPEKGINALSNNGFFNRDDPRSVAKFLLETEGLNKTQIGEFLGEGETRNITIMHAFVDELDFSNQSFVQALRSFLQTFRLPGESQKIDRFMLKFAERYVHFNPNIFANAETAYVLAYSVIMLNTDLYNPGVRSRMTLEEFISNNRGINDNADVPREILEDFYHDIATNEIRMQDEVDVAKETILTSSTTTSGVLGLTSGLQNALVSAGITRDARREAYQQAIEEIGSKTEAMFSNMLASRRRAGENEMITFYVASYVEHIRPMFEVAWMAFLAGISNPLQESDDLTTVNLCLEGFKNAIRIICLFHTVQSEDMDLQRDAFVTTLTKFTFLTNLNEMKSKNVEAIRTLLEVAAVDGNYLKGSWKEILSTVSQLEQFQLITSGAESIGGPMGDTNRRTSNVKASSEFGRRTSTLGGRGRLMNQARSGTQLSLTEEVASASSSQSLVVAVDRLFTSTVNLNGEAIVDFVRALCETSWEEIVSSAHMEHPRMYSLQKLVEISYYNMNRIRMEWSNIWAILGEYYNKVGCQSNFNVAFFALDSLRQLAMKFLEKEELPHFKFQKDFLMPFREILANNPDVAIKDMVLRCLLQMIQARAHHLKSGWKTMLSVFATGAYESSESIVHMTFDIVRSVTNERFGDIVSNGTFPDYVSCLVEFSKNQKFQKISLPALDMIKGTIPKMLDITNKSTPLEINDVHASSLSTMQASGDDFLIKFWFAVLYGLKEVVMQSDDVEVRKRALVYLFETLKKHGHTFTPEFWTTISRQIVFPLFDDLKSGGNFNAKRHMTAEDLSVWLSTTMIEALRNVVDLYTFYFDKMKDMMEHVLGLFAMCIIQDNDTLADIGCECLDQYIEANVEKFDDNCWNLITETFTHLFEKTTANGLFEDTEDLVERLKSFSNTNDTQPSDFGISEERQTNFQQVIIKCVLQLMLIQTVNGLLAKDSVYFAYPASHLMVLMDCLGRSFHFAKRFNANNDLRMALFRFGFMKQLPNLLKQETYSGGCYVSVLMRMYANLENINDRDDKREEIEKILIPLCNEIFTLYAELDQETKPKNIAAWTPVVVNILNGLSQLQDEDFLRHVPRFYLPSVELLGQESLLPEIRVALRTLLIRVGSAYHITASK